MKLIYFFALLLLPLRAFSSAQEISMAAEAAPEHITNNARYLQWSQGSFVEIKKGSNAFTCLVLRDHKGWFEPSCFNKPATDSVLPVYEFLSQQLELGKDITDIHSSIDRMSKSGQFTPPAQGAIVYMMSKRNKYYDHFGKVLYDPPPHIMLFYPHLSSDETGLNGQHGLPSIDSAFPHLSVIMIPID